MVWINEKYSSDVVNFFFGVVELYIEIVFYLGIGRYYVVFCEFCRRESKRYRGENDDGVFKYLCDFIFCRWMKF